MTEEEIFKVGEFLEHSGMSEDQIDSYFEHAGVKGMKWGVRKQKRLDRLNRVAAGQGNRRDRANVRLTEISSKNYVKNKGLEGAARSKASRMSARRDRILRGEATAKDLIAHYGGDRLWDSGKNV